VTWRERTNDHARSMSVPSKAIILGLKIKRQLVLNQRC